MRIFVAGHNGLVGAAFFRRLQAEDCEILTIPRAQLDLTDEKAVTDYFNTHKPDHVIMAAARVGGILDNMTHSADMFTQNIQIQTNIITAAHETKVKKLVFLGSSCIYPKDAKNPISEDALMTGPLEPTNEAYAMAKIAGIKMVQAYRRQYGHDWISLMPCNLYGPGDTFDLENSHVIPALMMKAHEAKIKNTDFVVWGSGTPRREFLYVDDLADAIIFALQNYSDEKPLNIGAGEDISIKELAETIADIVGFQGNIIFDPSKPDGIPRKLMDSSRLYKSGWKPQTPLRLGLEKTYAWYREHIADQKAA